jgi:hypothetical protein
MPLGCGFIHNTHYASKIKSVSVFHQIHCLACLSPAFILHAITQLTSLQHAIKLAYESRVNEVHKLRHPELVNPYLDHICANTHYDHVEHCFENLRQALMCHTDSNLEDVLGSETTGWGFERTCRNFGGLFKWS